MKRLLLTAALFCAALAAAAQGEVHVHGTDGSIQTIALGADDAICFNGSDILVLSGSSMQSFSTDAVRKLTFNGAVRIVDVAEATPLRLSPNPASGEVRLYGIGSEPQAVAIFDTEGRAALRTTATDGQPIDLGSLPQGIYLVQVGSRCAKLIKR